jgi:hypothetical protein
MIPVPSLTPSLPGLWLGLVTPVYAPVGRELIEGVRNPTVVRDDRALRDFGIRPRGIREVLARALVNEDLGFAATAGRTRFRPDTSAAVGADTASAAAGWTRARHGSPVPRSRRTARFPESEAT